MLPILVEIRTDPEWDVAKRRFGNIKKIALAQTVSYWHKKFAPLHFDRNNRNRYNLQPRRPAYRRRKKEFARHDPEIKHGGRNDLQYHGNLRKAVLRPHPVRATANQASMRIQGPPYYTERPKDPRKPHLALETTQVLDGEERDLSEFVNDRIQDQIDQLKAPKTTRP